MNSKQRRARKRRFKLGDVFYTMTGADMRTGKLYWHECNEYGVPVGETCHGPFNTTEECNQHISEHIRETLREQRNRPSKRK